MSYRLWRSTPVSLVTVQPFGRTVTEFAHDKSPSARGEFFSCFRCSFTANQQSDWLWANSCLVCVIGMRLEG